MSYEGYEQQLCQMGHYLEVDCYISTNHCWCGHFIVWTNNVDQTNGDDQGVILMDQFKVKDAQVNKCSACNHTTESPATYRIPSEQEKIAAKIYWSQDKDDI